MKAGRDCNNLLPIEGVARRVGAGDAGGAVYRCSSKSSCFSPDTSSVDVLGKGVYETERLFCDSYAMLVEVVRQLQ